MNALQGKDERVDWCRDPAVTPTRAAMGSMSQKRLHSSIDVGRACTEGAAWNAMRGKRACTLIGVDATEVAAWNALQGEQRKGDKTDWSRCC